MNRKARPFVALAACASLMVTGCGRSDSDDDSKSPGVTAEPCPHAVDKTKGCIYLGSISDLTGPFKGVGVPVTAAQKSFWDEVNAAGGIGDYEVDVTTYVRDNKYDPDTHAQVYKEIKDHVLALSQSMGTSQTNAILDDARKEKMLILPASLGSNWLFEDSVVEFGTSYCAEGMNIVDYAVDELDAKSVAAVHLPGDYGDDAMVGARIAAEERGVKFTSIETAPGAEAQNSVVATIVREAPDVVVVSTSPIELAAIVGSAVGQGFEGKFIGSIPSWNAALLQTPAGPALKKSYLQATSFPTWDADTPGNDAMRKAAGKTAPSDYYLLGWAGSYVVKAILDKAVANDDLSRNGLVEAARTLDGVDGEGMLADGVGNYASDDANASAVRVTMLNSVDSTTSTGVSTTVDAFVGPTVKGYDFKEACYLKK